MTHHPRFALLRIVVLVSLALRCSTGDAVGLGPLQLQSALGQPLRATVQVLGSDAGTLSETCIRINLKMPDGSDIVRPQFELRRSRATAIELAISTTGKIDEPAVALLVEITCAPTLHRDYQLLLDLRDGLPRVVSTMADELKPAKQARSATGLARDNGDEGSAGSRKRGRRSSAGGVRSVAASELEAMPADDAVKAPAARVKAAPVARNVLKLTQTDTLQGDSLQSTSRQPAGLKLSQSLGMEIDSAQLQSDELGAAKARFQAILRGEDALVAARRELKALQNRSAPATPAPVSSIAGQPAAASPRPAQAGEVAGGPEAQKAAGDAAVKPAAVQQPAVSGSRGAFASTSLLLGMALLAAAGAAMIWRHLHATRRRGVKVDGKKQPWWLTSGDDASREADLLASARGSVARKKSASVDMKLWAAVEGDKVIEADKADKADKVLARYVQHFVGKRDKAVHDANARIDPLGPASLEDEKAAVGQTVPEKRKLPKIVPHDQGLSDLSHLDDAPRPLGRNKLATFELVSDVMQEAEFWKMLNETQRAIDILENYCNSAESASPAPWLYLADLYEGLGDAERHAQLCNRFREIFNGRLHEADAITPAGRETLEGYPHLMEKISELWGQEAIVPFLQGLLVNDRESPREGFYLPVYQEILLLIDVALERESAVA